MMKANDRRSSDEFDRGYQAILSGTGFCVLQDRALVRMTGDDRISFLHGMCTADIKGLIPGMVAVGLFVTEHSHLIADCFIYGLDDALLIEFARNSWRRVRDHLERFLVADDVEMEEENNLAIIDVEGPAAASVLAGHLGIPPPSDNWRMNPSTMLARFPRFGAPAFTMILEDNALQRTLEQLRNGNAIEIDLAVLETIRIENGIARIGIDTTEKTLALEGRCERAISFNKGCYIGQETIERATARGAIKRRLYGLRIEGDRTPCIGATITFGGDTVGKLTSVARSSRFGTIGLAVLHHTVWSEGSRVAVQDQGAQFNARVSELPFSGGDSG
jgi:folate-binding protein YgfZ